LRLRWAPARGQALLNCRLPPDRRCRRRPMLGLQPLGNPVTGQPHGRAAGADSCLPGGC